MLILLLSGGAIYLVLGSLQEALLLIVFASLSVIITVVQESRTERVLETLRDLTSPRALVIRDGEHVRIAGRDVVRGDLLLLAEGDRVAADALLIEANDLLTDESLLTGESVPVRKRVAGDENENSPRPGGDDLPFVFSGSLVVRGHASARVTATGIRSEIGRIGLALRNVELEPPRLQKQLLRVVRVFGALGGAVALLVVVLYGLFRGTWIDGILAGIAVGMSMLPEEFPVVLTVFMAMGAWRISKARVLTRRAAAIETLGSATVLCTDKTGTLTQNRMSIAEIRLPTGAAHNVPTSLDAPLPPNFAELIEIGTLGSAVAPHDPMEKAFHALIAQHRAASGTIPETGSLVHSYGLRPELLAMSNAWQRSGSSKSCIATKGAPEAIAHLCRLDPDARAQQRRDVDEMASRGIRVLGIAQGVFDGDAWPDSQTGFEFQYLGLVGLADPLRPGVTDAVKRCQSAGIRVVMITGDYPATARAIAAAANIRATRVLSGSDLEKLSDEALSEQISKVSVFARIMPNQKLRIVEALKAHGEVVAMTGDGVNDAPSLKAAHIGIAMGGRGTDVAREASSIVLLDDDFSSMVRAIALGRRIYDNLCKAMGFIFAVHVPIAGMAVIPLLAGFPLLLGPVHIAFLEMIIDPVCSLVFEAEPEEENTMNRPPRNPEEPLFSKKMVAWGVIQGLMVLILVGSIFIIALKSGLPEAEVRALSFFSLVASFIGLIFVNRSFDASVLKALMRKNVALLYVICAVCLILGLTLTVPFMADLFHFGPLHLHDLFVVLGTGAFVLLALDAAKLPLFRANKQV
jgi:Ca2+-transporting ATPase